MMMTVPQMTVEYYGTTPTSMADGQTITKWGVNFHVTHSYDDATDSVTKRDTALQKNFVANVPVIKTPAKIWDATANEGAGGYVDNTEGKKFVVDALDRDGGDANPWTDYLNNTNGGIIGGKNFYLATPGHLGIYLNGTKAFDDAVYFPDNNYQTINQAGTYLKPNQTVAADTKLYAFRQYARELTEADMAQNNFADLAKWFGLEVSAWFFMPESIREKAYAAMIEERYTFDSNPVAVQETIDEIFAEYYDGLTIYTGEGADEKNAAFRELALATWMNVDSIRNLGAVRREALVGGLVDSFDLNYSFNPLVLRGEYDLLTKQLTAMSFVGYQVRIDTGAPSQNYAGVRAVFDVDTALIEELVRSTGKSVTVSAGIKLGDERVATISFVFSLDGDEITVVGENRVFGATPEEDIVKEAALYERAEGITSFNYVMTYKSAEAATAENFAIEYSYVYDILVDGENNDFSVTTKKLGPTVSAYEVYSLFAAMDAYKDDVVVKSVVPATAE
jgi:hypothetical protein